MRFNLHILKVLDFQQFTSTLYYNDFISEIKNNLWYCIKNYDTLMLANILCINSDIGILKTTIIFRILKLYINYISNYFL